MQHYTQNQQEEGSSHFYQPNDPYHTHHQQQSQQQLQSHNPHLSSILPNQSSNVAVPSPLHTPLNSPSGSDSSYSSSEHSSPEQKNDGHTHLKIVTYSDSESSSSYPSSDKHSESSTSPSSQASGTISGPYVIIHTGDDHSFMIPVEDACMSETLRTMMAPQTRCSGIGGMMMDIF